MMNRIVASTTDLESLRERLYNLIRDKADYSDILEVSELLDDAITTHYCQFLSA